MPPARKRRGTQSESYLPHSALYRLGGFPAPSTPGAITWLVSTKDLEGGLDMSLWAIILYLLYTFLMGWGSWPFSIL